MDWWRCYHGMPNDAKLTIVARRAGARRGDVASVWLYCLDYASQNKRERGSVDGLDPEEIAVCYDYDVEYVSSILDALQAKEMILDGGMLSAWKHRQPEKEDKTAADRQRKRRLRKDEDVTVCHGVTSVTERDTTVTSVTSRQSRCDERDKRDVTPERKKEREKEEREEKLSDSPSQMSFSASWILDETFTPFAEEYRKAKPNVLEDELASAHFAWKRLDFDQKLKAVDGIRKRLDFGIWDPQQPQFVPAPSKYLQSEWRRDVINPKPNRDGEWKHTAIVIG